MLETLVCRLFAFFVLLAALAAAMPARAASSEHAFQMWQPVYADLPIINKKLRAYFEVNPRENDGMDGMSQCLIRPGVGVRFNRHLAAYAGYCWVANFQPVFLQEQRLWQQLGFGYKVGKRLAVLHRLRMEERFIQHTDNQTAARLRYMLRLVLPVRGRWYLVGYDELFINLNSVENGPVRGIDQNRVFGGIGRQINDHLRIEAGYQQQYVQRQDPTADKANHILLTQFFIDF